MDISQQKINTDNEKQPDFYRSDGLYCLIKNESHAWFARSDERFKFNLDKQQWSSEEIQFVYETLKDDEYHCDTISETDEFGHTAHYFVIDLYYRK
jgi:hypothetical protein